MQRIRYNVEYKKDVVKLMVIDGLSSLKPSEKLGLRTGYGASEQIFYNVG